MYTLFETIQKYYQMGLYNEEKIKVFFNAGKITEDQYKQIMDRA